MKLLNRRVSESQYKFAAAAASIGTACLLTVIKGGAAFITGSLSILSSTADSLADVISSIITFVAVLYSGKPITCDHRYGFGRAEAVSALIQAAFISGSACFILYDAIYRFFHPIIIKDTFFGICVMIISMILTAVLIVFQRFIIRRIRSQAIEADNSHYVIDLAANAAVLVSLAAVHWLNWEWFDILAAVLISCYLMFTAFKIARKALAEITDKEVDNSIKADIIREVLKIDGIKGYHDLRSRISGSKLFFEIHLEFDGRKSLFYTHEIAEQAENKITKMYPNAQIIIHQDPYGIEEKRMDNDISDPCSL